jgi:hypothetical protein
VRWVLEEAAHKAKTRPPFVGFYAQCATRRGRHIATVAVARKLLARSFHILSKLQPPTEENAKPAGKVRSLGALETEHVPAIRPRVLTEQPGPDLIVMRILPPVGGPNGCLRDQLRLAAVDRSRVFLPPDPAPALAAVKVAGSCQPL